LRSASIQFTWDSFLENRRGEKTEGKQLYLQGMSAVIYIAHPRPRNAEELRDHPVSSGIKWCSRSY
jgi:hypothetical protein